MEADAEFSVILPSYAGFLPMFPRMLSTSEISTLFDDFRRKKSASSFCFDLYRVVFREDRSEFYHLMVKFLPAGTGIVSAFLLNSTSFGSNSANCR
ncbi:MAG: hypothetical protein EA344_09750 [Alkalicoccus sp.]|nr:MAG: hypothetical protein EA344_09750 [Alkalicoccus sp.]